MRKIFIVGIIIITILFLVTAIIYLKKENIEKEKMSPILADTIRTENSFVKCEEIKIATEAERPLADWIYLLDAYSGTPEKHHWLAVALEPGGYGVGGHDFPLDSPVLESQDPLDIDSNGMVDEVIALGVNNRKMGDYLIIVEPDMDVSENSTYGLQVNISSQDYILAKDVPYSPNALDRIYVLRSTETGIIPIVPASVGCREGYK